MILFNKQIINPGRFRTPQYSISPFSTEYVSRNYQLLQSQLSVDHDLLSSRFGNYILCENGRSAIQHALEQYRLQTDDEVYIVTTTGNKYISSCVTQQIERLCNWSRNLTDRTKVIYVNHEFGVVYQDMLELKKIGLPIIEDMAMSMLSSDPIKNTGGYGDFTIYSLAKFFPMQYGGVLRINNEDAVRSTFRVDPTVSRDLKVLLSHYLLDADSIKLKRIQNHSLLSSGMRSLGFHDRFQYTENETPSVYMFTSAAEVNLQELKLFMQENGVEASVFYGESAFFIPVHQYLDKVDIDFFTSLIEYFLYKSDERTRNEQRLGISASFSTNP